MASDLVAVENRLWATADQLWANTGLKPSEFSTPVLGLIFLRYADKRFGECAQMLDAKGIPADEREAMDYQAEGVLYLPDEARFSHLLTLTEGSNLGRAIATAMALVEEHNPELKGVLPRGYNLLPNATLVELLRLLASVDLGGDAFGKVYEYFLGNFALKEGQKGGVFFTPTSIVRLIVEILQPFHGRIFDPACGSGGMFVQSADFVRRATTRAPTASSPCSAPKASDTVKLAKMNLAVHGLSGDIREANTYYEDPHKALGRFDFVMANPPFNVSGVDKDRLKDDRRFPLGLPSTDNANYLWIQLFYSALNENGRAGFVMANSAGDARGSELEIRKKLIQSGAVDVIVSIGSNFFYTVTLPCTLWFFDKAKARGPRKDKVLFLDARPFFKQVTRAIREFAPEQLEFLANVVR
ncbi:MAG: SAM-dependent DNA methyltransferase, partial [Ideonella sp.]|nr:SAM-dependent DNA methyltransferase [Ideonella sp.]